MSIDDELASQRRRKSCIGMNQRPTPYRCGAQGECRRVEEEARDQAAQALVDSFRRFKG